MVRILDTLKGEFPQIMIDSQDAKGKEEPDTRWFYPRGVERTRHVFLQVWGHPRAKRIDFVIHRDLLKPEDMRWYDENNKYNTENIAVLKIPEAKMSECQLLEFVREKLSLYCAKIEG